MERQVRTGRREAYRLRMIIWALCLLSVGSLASCQSGNDHDSSIYSLPPEARNITWNHELPQAAYDGDLDQVTHGSKLNRCSLRRCTM